MKNLRHKGCHELRRFENFCLTGLLGRVADTVDSETPLCILEWWNDLKPFYLKDILCYNYILLYGF